MTLEGVSFWPFYSINDLKSAFGKLSPNKKIVSFQQILKVGENIKIDICKCPINVELVKKSSNRPGHLQMPFQIHLLLCAWGKNLTNDLSTTMIPIDIGKGFLLLDDGNHFYVVRDCDLTIILLSIPSSRLGLT